MSCQDGLIVALATANAVSALAVVRLSGSGALALVENLMGLQAGFFASKKRAVGNFSDLDYLVAIAWASGKSYTGEEMVDLICHGSPDTAVSIISKLEQEGARLALPGEFTRRAWKNGKLTEFDVLALSAKYQKNEAADNLKPLVTRLSHITVELEGFIEFGEDHDVGDIHPITTLIADAFSLVDILIGKVKSIEFLPRVFFMGPVNAGKSTLFNTLVGKQFAVVSDEPGTTRDGLSKTISLRGRSVELCDSAGFGGFNLDSQALSLILNSLKDSDRIIWMDPQGEPPPKRIDSSHDLLMVCSKADLKTEQNTTRGWIDYSSINSDGLEEIIEFIIKEEAGSPSWRLQRIRDLLFQAQNVVTTGDFALLAEIFTDIHHEANIPIRSGEAVERALDRFCVGK